MKFLVFFLALTSIAQTPPSREYDSKDVHIRIMPIPEKPGFVIVLADAKRKDVDHAIVDIFYNTEVLFEDKKTNLLLNKEVTLVLVEGAATGSDPIQVSVAKVAFVRVTLLTEKSQVELGR
jgi:hypothetical protein